MNNRKLSVIDIKTKDAIKLKSLQPDKTYPEENVLSEYGLYIYLY